VEEKVPVNKVPNVVPKENEPLSELDARVLKSMLQEDKLDLSEEANLKKLLERGVAPKSAPIPETKQEDNDNNDSPYASTLFKVRDWSGKVL
jgi:hypothetical protein